MADFKTFFSTPKENQAGGIPKHGNDRITYLHYEKLIESSMQYRKFSDEEVDEMADLIAGAGKILQPLLVRKSDADEYEILSGHKRRAGARLLVEERKMEKYAFLPCIVCTADDVQARFAVVGSNMRPPQTPAETLHEIQEMRALLTAFPEAFPDLKGGGRMVERLAEKLNMSRTVVSEYRKIENNLGKDAMEAFEDGRLDKSAALELASLPQDEQEQLILKGILTYTEIKNYRKAKSEAEEAKRQEAPIENQEPEGEQKPDGPLSALGFPKTAWKEGTLGILPGCGNGKYSCFLCSRECGIRQEKRQCRVSTCGNPKPCLQLDGDGLSEKLQHSPYKDSCQLLHQELAPTNAGDKEPDPCCLHCGNKTCATRCVNAKNQDQDEAERKEELDKIREQQKKAEAELPEPEEDEIRLLYNDLIKEGQPIDAAYLRDRYRHAATFGGDLCWAGSPRGIRINQKKELTWAQIAKAFRDIQTQEQGACVEPYKDGRTEEAGATEEQEAGTEQKPVEYGLTDVEALLKNEKVYYETGADADCPLKYLQTHKILVDALTLLFNELAKEKD